MVVAAVVTRAAEVVAGILVAEAVDISLAEAAMLLVVSMRVRRMRAVAVRRGMAGRHLLRRRARPGLLELLLERGLCRDWRRLRTSLNRATCGKRRQVIRIEWDLRRPRT